MHDLPYGEVRLGTTSRLNLAREKARGCETPSYRVGTVLVHAALSSHHADHDLVAVTRRFESIVGAPLIGWVHLCSPSIDAAQLAKRRRQLPSGRSLSGREVYRLNSRRFGDLLAMVQPATTSGVIPAGVSGVKGLSQLVLRHVANKLLHSTPNSDAETAPSIGIGHVGDAPPKVLGA